MRPRTLDEFVGQDHLLAPGRILRRLIEEDRLTSLVFWGPPGSGKTTLARVIANRTASEFVAVQRGHFGHQGDTAGDEGRGRDAHETRTPHGSLH